MVSIVKKAISLFVLNILAMASIAQSPYLPVRISGNIKLDGKLDESEWMLAAPVTEFIQEAPVAGAPPTERTEVRVLYNDEYLFVGFHCYDSEPDNIVRFFMDRDFSIGNDDGTSVELDTYNDKSTAVIFITNTLNGRFDTEVSNNGSNTNDDYNNFWDAATAVDSTGYVSEYRIPFSSLRFEQKEKVVMGFRFARLIKRKNELLTYPHCDSTINNMWCNVSQAAEMEFTNLKTKKPIYITPYVIANFEHQNNLNSDGTAYESTSTFLTRKYYSNNETLDKIISNIGADIKYGLTKNFTLNVTLNTDFAQAEVDNRIINLTKYEINLPEKRSFFLESQAYLNYQVGASTQLFTSRSIGLENDAAVPIIAGVRVTGKQNNLAIGALNMQTSDVSSQNIVAQNFTVARLRKYYGEYGSFYGGIVTNRISTGNNSVSNQSVGIDAVHNFNEKWLAGFGVATTYDSTVSKTFNSNQFLNLFVFKNASEGFVHGFDFEYAGEKFDPAMGFNPESDYGYVSVNTAKITKFKDNKIFNSWSLGGQVDYRWKIDAKITETKFMNLAGDLSWKKGSSVNATLAEYKEDRLFSGLELNDHITVPVGYYYMFTNDINLEYDQSKSYTASIDFKYGDYYGGEIFSVAPSVSYIINRFFRMSIYYEYNHISFPSGYSNNGDAVYKSNLVSGDFMLTLSSKFSVKLLAQFDNESNSYGGNLRIRYNPREGTDLYVVYNSLLNTNRLRAEPTLPLVDQQVIVVKYLTTIGL